MATPAPVQASVSIFSLTSQEKEDVDEVLGFTYLPFFKGVMIKYKVDSRYVDTMLSEIWSFNRYFSRFSERILLNLPVN